MNSLQHLIFFLKRYLSSIFIVLATISTYLFSREPSIVETDYSNGFYLLWVKGFPYVTSLVSFSVGDILYGFLMFYMVLLIFSLLRKKTNPQAVNTRSKFFRVAIKCSRNIFVVYLIFVWVWGMNYFRSDISVAFKVNKSAYSKSELIELNQNLLFKIKVFRPTIKSQLSDLNESARKAYVSLGLISNRDSERLKVKKSVFSKAIAYLGVSGYYNPFTGEAQIDEFYPQSIKSFVTAHEMAHQLGHAREDDANYLAFLASENTSDSALIYATQLQIFLYANVALYECDSANAKKFRNELPLESKGDIKNLFLYYNSKKNPVEPIVSNLFGWFLKRHRQPQGVVTYSKVLSLVMDYYRNNKRDFR